MTQDFVTMTSLVERLKSFNAHREPQLIQLKYQRMRANVFSFFRGTCHLFYADWQPNPGLDQTPLAWLCGDLHPDNFGSYKGVNRLAYFDINDFDEAALGPCVVDPVRFTTAILVGAPLVKITSPQAAALNDLFLKTYASHLNEGYIRTVERETSDGLVQQLLESLKSRSRKEFLDTRTYFKGKKRRLLIDNVRCLPVSDVVRRRVTKLIEARGEHNDRKNFFNVLDVGSRIAGTGSIGLGRYIILVEGNGSPNENYLLDLKEGRPSLLQAYLKVQQPEWKNDAERIITIQKRAQGTPPALLVATELDNTAYTLSEMQPFDDRVSFATYHGKLIWLQKLVKTEASILAWDQLRSSGRQGSAPADDLMAFGNSTGWQAAIIQSAEKQAMTINRYFHEFADAYDKGAFVAETEAD